MEVIERTPWPAKSILDYSKNKRRPLGIFDNFPRPNFLNLTSMKRPAKQK